VLDTSLDISVFAFAAGVALLATVLIGLLPALRATSGDLNGQMKKSGPITAGPFQSARQRSSVSWQHSLPRVLMAIEIAVALILVVGAGLLATSLVRLYRTGLGFNSKGLINLHLTIGEQALRGEPLIRWYRQYAEALEQLPGVTQVSYELMTPLTGAMQFSQFKSSLSQGESQIFGNEVAPGYFATMQIPMLDGREFTWDDLLAASNGAPRKIILNRAAAQLFFPGQNPIGQSVFAHGGKAYEVIAVVGNVRYTTVRDDPPPTAYRPVEIAAGNMLNLTAVVRVTGPVGPFAAAMRPLNTRMAPGIPTPELTTMSSQLDDSIRSERMMAMLSVFFAVCALLVTGIGLYGTLAYATARRTSEIGIRMALGARRTQVMGMVFRANAAVAICGSLAGLLAAMLASRVLASFLYGTSARDPWVMVGSVAALALIASAASLMPAWRAARIEPMQALRAE